MKFSLFTVVAFLLCSCAKKPQAPCPKPPVEEQAEKKVDEDGPWIDLGPTDP